MTYKLIQHFINRTKDNVFFTDGFFTAVHIISSNFIYFTCTWKLNADNMEESRKYMEYKLKFLYF